LIGRCFESLFWELVVEFVFVYILHSIVGSPYDIYEETSLLQ
jgi:hypothetical protein